MVLSRESLLLALVLGSGMSLGGVRAGAQTIIDTIPTWNGSTNVYYFMAPPSQTQTYGQTITALLSQNVLTNFSFEIAPVSLSTAITVKAYIYEWNGSRATGPALYTSSPLTITAPVSGPLPYQLITFNTGGITLTPGSQYVLFASSTNQSGTGSWMWGGQSEVYSGGSFVYLNNSTTGEWTSSSWVQGFSGVDDLAFKVTLVPEPGTWSLLVAGLGMAAIFRGRRRLSRAG